MQELLDLIGDIYEAAYQPGLWDDVLKKLCTLMDSRSGAIFFHDFEDNTRDMLGSFGLPTATLLAYRLGLSKYDYTFQMQATAPSGRAQQLVDSEDFKKSHPFYYRFLLKPNDIGFLGAINIYNDEEWHIGIGLHRSFTNQPFSQEELAKLELLLPHFQRALRIQKEFVHLRREKQTLETALNRFMLGVIILNSDNSLYYTNPVAENFLTKHPALRINSEQRLQAHSAQENITLYNSLFKLRQTDKKQRASNQVALSVHHPDKEHGLHILAVRLDENEANPLLALYIADPELSFNLPPEALQNLYGMTPAEANVAIALANGASAQQISERHQVSIETVRSQLKSIYSKMNVNRQQDVVRLLLSGVLRAK